eukprot:gene7461-10918_t
MSGEEIPAWVKCAREGWTHTGKNRPPFAEVPEDGKESVWDYPRPPLAVEDARHVVVKLKGTDTIVADSTITVRILETSHPPTFYIPKKDVNMELLKIAAGSSMCEWKGQATYYGVESSAPRSCWSYDSPFSEMTLIKDHVSFYPSQFDCTVGGEKVTPQPGGFYGGWITPELAGPFKGDAGTSGW